MSATTSDIRISLRLSRENKKAIEDAATELGQSTNAFAISTLVETARRILRDQPFTRISRRDQKLFMAMLNEESSKPNAALLKAAKRYKKQVG